MVRIYAIADGGGRWHVLPGGMTRLAQREDSSVSMQRGGISLDTWVLTQGAANAYSILPARLHVDDIAGCRRPVSSRIAENLFWLARYTELTEPTERTERTERIERIERTEQAVQPSRATLLLVACDEDASPQMLHALTELAIRSGLVPQAVPGLNRAPKFLHRPRPQLKWAWMLLQWLRSPAAEISNKRVGFP